MITEARYTDYTHIPLIAVSDGREVYMSSYPSGTHYDEQMAAFLAGGGVIDPYNEYYGIPDDSLREQKYNLNAELAQAQVEAAEATPVEGPTLDERATKKENLKRDNRAKRNAGMNDADDEMADHVDDVMDVLDQADDTVENLNRADLEAWDGSLITWPVWSPPV